MKSKIIFRNLVPRLLLAMCGFPALYFDLVTNEIESKHVTQICQAVNSLRQ